MNRDFEWEEDISSDLVELQFFKPLILEKETEEYIINLFTSGYSDNGFYNNIYLNIYKLCIDNKSLHILQKMKIIGKKERDALNVENIKHNIFNSIEKDSLKHIAYLLDCEDDTNFNKRHNDIFNLRDNICHFNEIKISKDLFH